jgi:hypothetical protein
LLIQEPFHAFHNDLDYVRKFLHATRIGDLRENDRLLRSSVDDDFDKLRETARKMVRGRRIALSVRFAAVDLNAMFECNVLQN